MTDTPVPARFLRFLPTLVLLLTVFGPISMDLYLPALPALTASSGRPRPLHSAPCTP